jgi:23S rRNA (uridine2552-2'-O)-methyltransferase
MNGCIKAADKEYLKPEKFFFIKGDIFDTESCRLLEEKGPYQVVISDAAPSTSGDKMVDTLKSAALAERIIDISKLLLAEGGSLVIKIFQGGEEGNLRNLLRQSFTSVKSFKPQACRKNSFETYLIGQGKKNA